jgi:hypothetical protein
MTVASLDALTKGNAAQSAIMDRHSELQQVLDAWAGTLIFAVAHATPARPAVKLLRVFLADELLPHMRAEERTVYPAAARHPWTELLVRALVSENRSIAWHAGRLATETGPEAAATAEAIRSLFAVHVAKENYLLLPALARHRTGLAALVSREPVLVSRG